MRASPIADKTARNDAISSTTILTLWPKKNLPCPILSVRCAGERVGDHVEEPGSIPVLYQSLASSTPQRARHFTRSQVRGAAAMKPRAHNRSSLKRSSRQRPPRADISGLTWNQM
jgi:hypothetical protein